jgi:hypothetical protein
MGRNQLHTLDHPLLPVIVEPIFARLEAGNDWMPRGRRMLGCMLTGRTVTAPDVPTFRAAAEVKPPTFRRGQTFDASVATWFRSGVNSALILIHFDFSLASSVRKMISSHRQYFPDTNFFCRGLRFDRVGARLPDEPAQRSVQGRLQTLLRRSAGLWLPDFEDDLAGLVRCARKHGLRLASLRKRQD